jgi:hypothetical protein
MKTRALFLALPLLALGALGGCRDNSASLQIQAMCFPTDDCTFGSTCDNSFMGVATLDPTLGTTSAALTLIFQLENQVPDNEDLDLGRTNTNDAQVDEIQIEYDGPAVPRQVMGANVWVPANGTTLIVIPVIPPGFNTQLTAYASPFGREMTARVRLGGFWYHGDRFETAEFPVAVKICDGCLGAGCGSFPTCPPDRPAQLPVVCMEPESATTP